MLLFFDHELRRLVVQTARHDICSIHLMLTNYGLRFYSLRYPVADLSSLKRRKHTVVLLGYSQAKICSGQILISHLEDDIIGLRLPESFRLLYFRTSNKLFLTFDQ